MTKKFLFAILVFFLLNFPAWGIIHLVTDEGTDLIMVGLGVQELGDVEIEGPAPEDEFTPGFYSEGRVAFYLKGKIKGKYLLQLAFDSDKPALETAEAFIEPEKYYPVYGDKSQLSTDVSSQGKLYVMLQKDTSYLLYGRYSTEFNDTQFATYDRILRGAKIHYESEKHSFTLFNVRTNQIYAEDEFPEERCLGGICEDDGNRRLGSRGPYYLSHKPVIEGTERVTIEVRDKDDLDEVLQSTPQFKDTDYTIDYTRGRIMFSRFVPSWTPEGNPIFIVVKYEAISPEEVPKTTIIGGKINLQLRENASFGITYLQDERSDSSHNLTDFNASIGMGEFLGVEAEYARSSQEEEDSASSLVLNYTPLPGLQFKGTYKQVRPNFMDFADTESDVEEYTVEGTFSLSPDFDFSATVERSRDNVLRDPARSTAITTNYGVSLIYAGEKFPEITLGFNMENKEEKGGDIFSVTDTTDQGLSLTIDNQKGGFTYTLELSMEDSIDHTGYSSDTSKLGAALTLPFKIGELIEASLTQEYELEKEKQTSDKLSQSHKTTLGWETQLGARWSIAGSYSFEDSLSFLDMEKTRIHTATLTLDGDLTEKLTTQIGYELQLTDNSDYSISDTFSLGFDYSPFEVLNLKGGYEMRKEKFENDSEVTYVYDFSTDYVPHPDFSASLAATVEQGEDEISQNLSLSLEGKPHQNITLSGSFSQESYQDAHTNKMLTRSTDTTLALAYRPLYFDRFNGLLKCEIKTDEDWTSDIPTSTTILLAGEGIYDLTDRLSLFGKYAQKRFSQEEETTSDMFVIRPAYKIGLKFDVATEYRILRHIETQDQRVSTSVEVGYRLTHYLKVIAGYNFQEYEDLKAGENEWKARGPYARIVCQL